MAWVPTWTRTEVTERHDPADLADAGERLHKWVAAMRQARTNETKD